MPDGRESYEQRDVGMVYGPAFGPEQQAAYDRQRAGQLPLTEIRDMVDSDAELTQEQLDRDLALARHYERQGCSWDDALEKARGGPSLYGRVQQQVRHQLREQLQQERAEDDEVLNFDRKLAEARHYERQGCSWDDAARRAGL